MSEAKKTIEIKCDTKDKIDWQFVAFNNYICRGRNCIEIVGEKKK